MNDNFCDFAPDRRGTHSKLERNEGVNNNPLSRIISIILISARNTIMPPDSLLQIWVCGLVFFSEPILWGRRSVHASQSSRAPPQSAGTRRASDNTQADSTTLSESLISCECRNYISDHGEVF